MLSLFIFQLQNTHTSFVQSFVLDDLLTGWLTRVLALVRVLVSILAARRYTHSHEEGLEDHCKEHRCRVRKL